MKNKLLTGLFGAAALSALLLTSCGDIDLITNADLGITSYVYDDWLDPTRGESEYKNTPIIGSMVENLKIYVALNIYMDNMSTVAGRVYQGSNGNKVADITEHTGQYELYCGTLENGVIHLKGSLGKIMGMIDLGSDWYMQVIDGKTMISVAAPHSDWLFSTDGVSAAALRPASLTTIADEQGSEDTQNYSGQPYTTVSFPGNPSCMTPNIRYATCVIHGDKVKAQMKLGKNENSTGTGEVQAVFNLPEQSKESGTIEFTANNNVTYEATWARRRYDVRISEITVKSDASE